MRIIRFDRPERVVGGPPCHRIRYRGCNHEGYEGGGHHLPVGSRWTDIWGTEWHREHEGVMGFPRGNPLADLARDLPRFRWPDPDEVRRRLWQLGREGGYFCGPDQGMPWPEEHIAALRAAAEESGAYPLQSHGRGSPAPP